MFQYDATQPLSFTNNPPLGAALERLSDRSRPSEAQMSEMRLLDSGWERVQIDHLTAWNDPVGGGDYLFENAVRIQDARDMAENEGAETEPPAAPAETTAPPNSARIGIEYHARKARPYRGYYEVGGVKTYVGYYANEQWAWNAANQSAQKAAKVVSAETTK